MSDGHAGKSGRCPFCKGVVRIPAESTRPVGDSPASSPHRDDPHGDVPPPPSSVAGSGDLEDEMNLVQITKDPASETDIIPAEANDEGRENQEELDVANHIEDGAESTEDHPLAGKPAPAHKKVVRPKNPLRFLLWAWVVLAALAVLCLLGYVIANR